MASTMLKLLLIREMSGTKLEEQRTRFLTVSLEEAVGREGEERETEVCVGFVGLVATVLSNTRSSGQGGFISRKGWGFTEKPPAARVFNNVGQTSTMAFFSSCQ